MYYMQRYFVLLFSVIRIANNSPSINYSENVVYDKWERTIMEYSNILCDLKNQNEIDKWKLQDPNFKLVISERIHQLFHL